MMSNGASPQMEPHVESPAPEESDAKESQQQPDRPTGPDALNEAVRRAAEAREYFVHLLAVEIDRLKLKFRRILILAAVGMAVLVLLLAVLLVAVALLLWGLANLIGAALGGHTWIGALIVGGGILLLASGAIWGGIWGWNRSSFHAARRRYEARKRRQQERFGHSVDPRK